MGQPAARLTDMHVCPMVTGLVPHVGGPIIGPCCPTVLIGGLPAARITDLCLCVGPPDVIVRGSAGVMIGGLPAARILDNTAHGGLIVMGMPTVLIGETMGGGGGGDGAAPGGGGPGLFATPGALVAYLLGGNPKDAAPGDDYGDIITIDGTPEFRTQALTALARILATPSGREWLKRMRASGHGITIEQGAPGQNECAPDNGADARNGKGTSSTIRWDPATTSLAGFSPAAVADCGNDTILFHEMVHGMHNAEGAHRNGPTETFPDQTGSSQRGEERSTVGTGPAVRQPGGGTRPVQQAGPPPSDAPADQQIDYNGTKPGENYPTENSYRRDKGIPERPSYYPSNWPGGPPW